MRSRLALVGLSLAGLWLLWASRQAHAAPPGVVEVLEYVPNEYGGGFTPIPTLVRLYEQDDGGEIPANLAPLSFDPIGTFMSVIDGRPLGVRNNNPGNLRETNINWRGKAADQSTGRGFTVFDTPEAGMRALFVNLRNQSRLNNLDTIRGIVERYAPRHGRTPNGRAYTNETAAYINTVARHMGVGPDVGLDLEDVATLRAFGEAIVMQEHGAKWLPFYESAGVIDAGIATMGA